MFNRIFLYLKNFDWVLLVSSLLLTAFGLMELYSIALGQENLNLLNFKKQIIFVFIGIILLFIFSFIDYHNWRSFSNYIYLLGILLLVAVLFFGQTIRGTTGWFNFLGISLQPVELSKLFLIIFLARFFSGNSIKLNPLRNLIISGLGALLFIGLVLWQPDFGSSLILFLVWAAMIVAAGFKKKYLIIIGVGILITFAISWGMLFKDYQKQRILTFINPSFDPLNQGYNITQAIIAVGSGGLFGRGVGFGSQSQLKFLPEAQNDFIFAVIAEELGFLGVFLVILFFSVILYRLLSKIKKLSNDFAIYYLIGLSALIFIQMFINIGMNIGLLPVVGISLPLLSYGGSSIIATSIMIGIAESIIIRSKIKY